MRPASRRWLIVAALFTVTYGVSTPLAAYGVFLPVFAETFAWSRGAISSALSLNLLLGGVAGFGIGALADRHGPRVMLVVTVVLAGSAFALVSTVGALWQLYLLVGVLGGIGMSSFYLLSTTTVTRWFDERRGLALASCSWGSTSATSPPGRCRRGSSRRLAGAPPTPRSGAFVAWSRCSRP